MTDLEADLILFKAENKQLKEENIKLKKLLNEVTTKYETSVNINTKNTKIINDLQKELEKYKNS
jgi:cell shape-determining protein MreC